LYLGEVELLHDRLELGDLGEVARRQVLGAADGTELRGQVGEQRGLFLVLAEHRRHLATARRFVGSGRTVAHPARRTVSSITLL
jgi:hypothetical protein